MSWSEEFPPKTATKTISPSAGAEAIPPVREVRERDPDASVVVEPTKRMPVASAYSSVAAEPVTANEPASALRVVLVLSVAAWPVIEKEPESATTSLPYSRLESTPPKVNVPVSAENSLP